MVITTGTIIYDENSAEFKVLEFIGAGSFGHVYKIKGKGKKEILALKTIETPFADPTIFKAFVNEGNLATKIIHENVIKYHFFHDGSKYSQLPPYLIMDYADGGTLEEILHDRRQNNEYFSNDELKVYFAQLISISTHKSEEAEAAQKRETPDVRRETQNLYSLCEAFFAEAISTYRIKRLLRCARNDEFGLLCFCAATFPLTLFQKFIILCLENSLVLIPLIHSKEINAF